MRITIVGAGIGGASAGIALTRLGHEVTVYEQVRANRPVGAALSLWPNAVKVLNWLGLADELAALGGRMDRMAYREGHSGAPMCDFSLAPVFEQTGQRAYPVVRADLQNLLWDRLGTQPAGGRIRLGKQLVEVRQEGETAVAVFADGEVVTSDLLIGADGARSLVRGFVAGPGIERAYSGYTNYNGIVPADPAIGQADTWTTYVADGKRAAVMPVAEGRFYFFADVPQPAGLAYDRAEGIAPLRAALDDWAPGVQRLLAAIDPETSFNRVEIWDIDPFHTWAKGRIAILGDAAHNTSPDIGQGGGMALEDAFVLATTLAAHPDDPVGALRRYHRIQSPRAAELVLRARRRALETHAFDPTVTEEWYAALRRESGEHVIRGLVGNTLDSPINLGVGALD